MICNIRYLAIYIISLKVCNVRYILSFKLQNMKLNTRNAVKYSFFTIVYRYNDQLWFTKSTDGITCYLASEIVLTIFTILFEVIIFNRL